MNGSGPTRWAPGDVVEYCDVKRGRVWWRMPARVVEDSHDLTVLWWPAGTRYQRPVESRSALLRGLAEGQWELQEVEWWGGDCLHVIPRGAPFAIWPYRGADHEHIGWYFNLQAPLTRTDRGFETDDWTLDVVASPDLSDWRWKDEDELLEGHEVGLYTTEDVERIRAAGADAISLIEGTGELFDQWSTWRPDRSWAIPSLG